MVLRRRAQLVAHARQEFAFQAVGSFHFLILQRKLLIGPCQLLRAALQTADSAPESSLRRRAAG